MNLLNSDQNTGRLERRQIDRKRVDLLLQLPEQIETCANEIDAPDQAPRETLVGDWKTNLAEFFCLQGWNVVKRGLNLALG